MRSHSAAFLRHSSAEQSDFIAARKRANSVGVPCACEARQLNAAVDALPSTLPFLARQNAAWRCGGYVPISSPKARRTAMPPPQPSGRSLSSVVPCPERRFARGLFLFGPSPMGAVSAFWGAAVGALLSAPPAVPVFFSAVSIAAETSENRGIPRVIRRG